MRKIHLINSKTVFISTLIVGPVLTLIIYLTGREEHRSLYLNSIISTTILSVVFLTFITTGLYKGWKLKDNLGNLLDKFKKWEKPSSMGLDITRLDTGLTHDANTGGEGIAGCLISLIAWIIIGLFGAIIFWLVGAIIWAAILMTAGLLYWIIFRAFRLIFRNSGKCKGDFFKSFKIAVVFTILYNSWIYAIILGTHFLSY